jgi:hypothetical protein
MVRGWRAFLQWGSNQTSVRSSLVGLYLKQGLCPTNRRRVSERSSAHSTSVRMWVDDSLRVPAFPSGVNAPLVTIPWCLSPGAIHGA